MLRHLRRNNADFKSYAAASLLMAAGAIGFAYWMMYGRRQSISVIEDADQLVDTASDHSFPASDSPSFASGREVQRSTSPL